MPGHKTVFNPSFSNDPGVQCRVHHRASAASRERYPIIAVPGGHRVPIRAKVYIRRPGPASEEPKTAEEWDRFFERCLQSRRAELLEAMRSIMTGVIPNAVPAIPTRFDELKAFETKAIARWETLVAPVPRGNYCHRRRDARGPIDCTVRARCQVQKKIPKSRPR